LGDEAFAIEATEKRFPKVKGPTPVNPAKVRRPFDFDFEFF